MQLTATKDFAAHMDGKDIALSKGETFKGTAKVADQLLANGLLEKPVKKPIERKEKHD